MSSNNIFDFQTIKETLDASLTNDWKSFAKQILDFYEYTYWEYRDGPIEYNNIKILHKESDLVDFCPVYFNINDGVLTLNYRGKFHKEIYEDVLAIELAAADFFLQQIRSIIQPGFIAPNFCTDYEDYMFYQDMFQFDYKDLKYEIDNFEDSEAYQTFTEYFVDRPSVAAYKSFLMCAVIKGKYKIDRNVIYERDDEVIKKNIIRKLNSMISETKTYADRHKDKDDFVKERMDFVLQEQEKFESYDVYELAALYFSTFRDSYKCIEAWHKKDIDPAEQDMFWVCIPNEQFFTKEHIENSAKRIKEYSRAYLVEFT